MKANPLHAVFLIRTASLSQDNLLQSMHCFASAGERHKQWPEPYRPVCEIRGEQTETLGKKEQMKTGILPERT
jgi:hypothetical protein